MLDHLACSLVAILTVLPKVRLMLWKQEWEWIKKKKKKGRMSLEMDKNLKKKNKANGECYVSWNGKIVSKR